MTWFTENLGSSLVTKSGTASTADATANKKLIALYFSAHWCPPCRGFTPVLGEFYDIVKELDENALEIIFVSSDNEKSAFDEYYGSMPWISLPFGSSHGQALGQTFGVRGIPSLIVLKPDGSVVDRDGRSTVSGVKGNVEKALSQWGVN